MNVVDVWAFLPATVLCSLNLCLGIGIGYIVADNRRSRRPRVRRTVESRPSRLATYEVGLDQLVRQASQLSSLCEAQKLPSVPTLTKAIEELVQAATTLRRQIGGGFKSPGPHERTKPAKEVKPSLGYDLSGSEFSNLVAEFDADDDSHPSIAVQSERRQYRVKQLMAPCVHGRLPAAEDFQPVLCNEISVGGISFYCDHAQVAQQLVITLGESDNRLFVVAEVKNRRVAQVDGNTIYLVGCRFLRRLDRKGDDVHLASYQALRSEELVPG
jgi:hypothetical protein